MQQKEMKNFWRSLKSFAFFRVLKEMEMLKKILFNLWRKLIKEDQYWLLENLDSIFHPDEIQNKTRKLWIV